MKNGSTMRQRKSWSVNNTKREKEKMWEQRLWREGRWGFYLQMGPCGPQNALLSIMSQKLNPHKSRRLKAEDGEGK